MKFKYFLRGLGTGIVFTSVICLIAFQSSDSKNISDKEVIERAKALGMVEKEESVEEVFGTQSLLSEKEDVVKNTTEKTTAEKSSTEQIDKEKNNNNQVKQEKTVENKITEKKVEDKTTEKESTTEESKTTENSNEKEADVKQNKTVTITIKGGSTSFPVCQKLQELGVIKDATDFDNYLIKHGYANRIRVGTHTLTIGMSYEEIAIAISDPV